jgi:hypothetical protein
MADERRWSGAQRALTAIFIALLAGCTPAGYHYEGGSFIANPEAPSASPAEPLVWCQPAGFDRPVPRSVCQTATGRLPQPSIEAIDAQQRAIKQCVERLTASGYVQSREGEINGICMRATPVQ